MSFIDVSPICKHHSIGFHMKKTSVEYSIVEWKWTITSAKFGTPTLFWHYYLTGIPYLSSSDCFIHLTLAPHGMVGEISKYNTGNAAKLKQCNVDSLQWLTHHIAASSWVVSYLSPVNRPIHLLLCKISPPVKIIHPLVSKRNIL